MTYQGLALRLTFARYQLETQGYKMAVWELGTGDLADFRVLVERGICDPPPDIVEAIKKSTVRYEGFEVHLSGCATSYAVGNAFGHDPIITRHRIAV